jgi:hypothetical protein
MGRQVVVVDVEHLCRVYEVMCRGMQGAYLSAERSGGGSCFMLLP